MTYVIFILEILDKSCFIDLTISHFSFLIALLSVFLKHIICHNVFDIMSAIIILDFSSIINTYHE